MPVKSESVGLSSARLERIDQTTQNKYIDTGKLKGALAPIALRRASKPLWRRCMLRRAGFAVGSA